MFTDESAEAVYETTTLGMARSIAAAIDRLEGARTGLAFLLDDFENPARAVSPRRVAHVASPTRLASAIAQVPVASELLDAILDQAERWAGRGRNLHSNEIERSNLEGPRVRGQIDSGTAKDLARALSEYATRRDRVTAYLALSYGRSRVKRDAIEDPKVGEALAELAAIWEGAALTNLRHKIAEARPVAAAVRPLEQAARVALERAQALEAAEADVDAAARCLAQARDVVAAAEREHEAARMRLAALRQPAASAA